MKVRFRGQPDEVPQQTKIEKPQELSDHASAHWDAVYPELEGMNILHPIDRPALVAMCEWWAEWKQLQSGEAGETGYKRAIALASCFKNWSAPAEKSGLSKTSSRPKNERDKTSSKSLSIKSTMQMYDLRCKTPELVRKEVWTHVLAYNLIRTIMVQAATQHGIEPRTISFKGAIQTLEAFQPVIELRGTRDSEYREYLYDRLLECIASHRVANRPNRFEPRKRKRRFKLYDFLNKPRHEAILDMLKGFSKN